MSKALDWVIFKIAQKCNINCSYCYVYNRGDDSWRHRPPIVDIRIVEKLAGRIREQCEKFSLSKFHIEFHGGEPLLVGKSKFEEIVRCMISEIPNTNLIFHLQTNGLLLDEEWLKLFRQYTINFGISIDGPPEIADVNRVDHKGEGTTEKLIGIIESLRRLEDFKETFGGVLCVIGNPQLNAEYMLNWFYTNGFDSIDFLLPDGNYHNPPSAIFSPSDYKNFMIDLYRAWIKLDEKAPAIRYFDYLIRGLLGEKIPLDSLGGDLSRMCTVESDGTIGISDVGRICPPLNVNSMNIFEHKFSDYSNLYKINDLQKISSKCKRCNFRTSCNGGYLPHRYDGVSFENPSYYCDTLYSLSSEMYNGIKKELENVK